MTVFHFRIYCLLVALSLVLGPARAADEINNNYGGYGVPGYQVPRGAVPGSAGGPSGGGYPGANQGGYPYPAYPQGVVPGGTRGSPGIFGSDAYQTGPGTRPEFLPRREPRPPPPPSEFQRFVERATGRMLPVFGSTFFSEAADSFSPVDNVPVAADYIVGPGDEINIRAWGSIDVDYWATVDRNGVLNLPKIGSFSVAGVKASELERHLRAQIGRLYTNFNLSVALGQLRAVKVFVVGPAQRPGVYTLPSQSSLLSAMVAAGGPSPTGSMRHVSLRRDGRIVSELDVYEFLGKGDKSKDLQLAPGDVIVFQPVGPQVALNGAVDTRAIYELKSTQEPLGEVLRYAGGAPVLANPNRVQLERIAPTRPRAARYVEEFRLDEAGLAKPLQDGDVLTLLQISPQFANAVTLRGHVAQPLRYPYTPGMRIRDLIPDREALISPDFYRRKNMLVQVIEDEETARGTGTERDERNAPRRDSRTGELRDGTSPTARDSGQTRVLPGGLGPRDANAVLLPDERARAVTADRQAAGTGAITPSSSANSVARDAADRPLKSPTALFDDLNWDYAVIERLNLNDLSTQVIPFNLGKAILHNDEENNVALLPGDVVTIFSQKDVRGPVARQTRLVWLEGEINSPGVYQLQPGETLRQLLVRAGGFTAQAYVYGLELSREETRQRQRENLRAAIARFQAISAVQTAREVANRRDEPGGAGATATVSNAATQAQLARLSQLEPNGRIALELTPDVNTLEELPDLPLENADRISVPSRPGFVTVAGAVVNSNAFVWKDGRTAGQYLSLAGPDEAADPSNMFILRADGTVTKAGERRGWFSRGGLEEQVMQPGDALIVPNQLDYETWGRALVRNLKDFSVIFSGFGLGIAAINSINN